MTIVAIIFGVLQAATQVQDASVSFTPKLAAALARHLARLDLDDRDVSAASCTKP